MGKTGNSADEEVTLVDFLEFHSLTFVKGVTVDVSNPHNPFYGGESGERELNPTVVVFIC